MNQITPNTKQFPSEKNCHGERTGSNHNTTNNASSKEQANTVKKPGKKCLGSQTVDEKPTNSKQQHNSMITNEKNSKENKVHLTSITKVRQIQSSYRKKIRGGGSQTAFGGGNLQNPTLMNTPSHGLNNDKISNTNFMTINMNIANHKTSNSNGNLYNQVNSPVVNGKLHMNPLMQSPTGNSIDNKSEHKKMIKNNIMNNLILNNNNNSKPSNKFTARVGSPNINNVIQNPTKIQNLFSANQQLNGSHTVKDQNMNSYGLNQINGAGKGQPTPKNPLQNFYSVFDFMSSPKQQFGGSHNGNHNNTIATASGVAMNKNKPKVTPHKKNATASKIGVKKKVKDDIEVLKDTKDEKIYELETNVIESLGDLRVTIFPLKKIDDLNGFAR